MDSYIIKGERTTTALGIHLLYDDALCTVHANARTVYSFRR